MTSSSSKITKEVLLACLRASGHPEASEVSSFSLSSGSEAGVNFNSNMMKVAVRWLPADQESFFVAKCSPDDPKLKIWHEKVN